MNRCKTGLTLLLLAWCVMRAIASDCPGPLDVWNTVLEIEQSDQLLPGKIALLDDLAGQYRRCAASEDSVLARILHRLGDYYRVSGDFATGIRLTREAISINRKDAPTASRSYLTNSYYNLALYYSLLSDFERSNEYFDSCLIYGMKSAAKTPIVLMACEQKCFNFFKMGEYQMGIDAADHGLFIARSAGETGYQGILLQQKAQSQLLLGATEDAERNGALAIEMLQKSNVRKEYLAAAMATYAKIMVARNEPSAAIQYYNKSIAQNTALNNWLQCSRDYMDLGYLYDYTLRDSARAIACYQKGIESLERSPDPYQLAGLYNNIGVVYWRNGDYGKALVSYQRGLNSLPVGFTDTAVHANPSRQMIGLISNDYFVSTLLENKGESFLLAFRQSGKRRFLECALQSFIMADKVVDQMRSKQVHDKSKLFWREKTRKMYENAVETCYLLNDVEHAFFFFEKSRAVLLNDRLNELGAGKILSHSDRLADRELRMEVQMLQQNLQDPTLDDHENDRLRRQWYTVQTKVREHNMRLRDKYPQYFRYKHDTTTTTLKDIRRHLIREKQTLVEYFTTDSVIYMLAIGPDEQSFTRLAFASFRDKVEQYLEFCSTPALLNARYGEFLTLSHMMYNSLFSTLPVKTKRVIISFDDYFIPFEAFITDPGSKNSFLVRDHIFLYIYSADFLLNEHSTRSLDESLLGVAPVWYNTVLNLPPLKGAESSLRKIRNSFGNSLFLVNENATRRSFMERFPEYSIVHVYSHAMADYSGGEPVLYFHDEAVKLTDLQMLPESRTQLLVLSGCRTGIGKTVKGEGVLSLARGFAAAGIPSTITTLWSVDDKVTYAIMEKFYERLKKGEPADEALQHAKLDFLAEYDGENELPYYWASSVLLGKSMKIDTASVSSSRVGLLAAAIAIALSLGAFLLRRRLTS